MPSRLKQEGIVFKGKRKKDGKTLYVVVAKRTGFMDVWIGNKRYYYNYSQKNIDPSKISIEKIIEDAESQEQKKSGVIVIRRK